MTAKARGNKEEIATMTVAAVSMLAKKLAKPEYLPDAPGPRYFASQSGLEISLLEVEDSWYLQTHGKYLVDVWHQGAKVFSIWWNSAFNDSDIVRLQRGPWFGLLLEWAGLTTNAPTSGSHSARVH